MKRCSNAPPSPRRLASGTTDRSSSCTSPEPSVITRKAECARRARRPRRRSPLRACRGNCRGSTAPRGSRSPARRHGEVGLGHRPPPDPLQERQSIGNARHQSLAARGPLRGGQRNAMPHVQRQRLGGSGALTCREPRAPNSPMARAEGMIVASTPSNAVRSATADGGEAVAGTEPASGRQHDVGGADDRRGERLAPVRVDTLVGRDVDLLHARVGTSEDACRAMNAMRLLRDGLERGHRSHREPPSECESLRDAAGDA